MALAPRRGDFFVRSQGPCVKCGRHERMHGTLKAETATPPARSLRAQARRFDVFVRVYNEERPHEALDMDVPDDHYTPSSRPYSGRLQSPHYPDHHQVRRVRRSGEIKWCNSYVYISQTLAGEPVGLVESDDGLWTVSFGPSATVWPYRTPFINGPTRTASSRVYRGR